MRSFQKKAPYLLGGTIMREQIVKDLVTAMKEKDKDKLAVLRMVKGAMQLEEIKKKSELTDDEVIAVLAKQIKTRKESIVEFEKGNRTDLIEQTEKEITILETYMPEQLSEEEITKIIEEAIQKVNASAPSDMGKVMGIITPQLRGKADMSAVSKMLKEKLAN